MAVEPSVYLRKVILAGRKRLGYTPETFAREVGMTAQAIRDYESGKTELPHDRNWKRMLEVLGFTAEDVLTAYLRGVSAEKLALSLKTEQRSLPL